MKNHFSKICLAGILLAATTATSSYAITFGQIDTFEDGTVADWGAGDTTNTFNIATGGPLGAGDHYLELDSGTFGGASRLIMFNPTQWTGNYNAAGVFKIEMDLKNFGGTALPIRIALRTGTGSAGTPGYSTTTAFTLAADSAWHHATFFLDVGNLTPFNSPIPLAALLDNVPDFRILSSASPGTRGDVLNARIGVDNIAAVPEPSAIILAATAFGAAILLRRRLVV